jgi:hypothetical protein
MVPPAVLRQLLSRDAERGRMTPHFPFHGHFEVKNGRPHGTCNGLARGTNRMLLVTLTECRLEIYGSRSSLSVRFPIYPF